MTIHGTGQFEGKSWDEHAYSEIDGGPKLARASITNAFHGEIEGEGTLEYLMIYHNDGTAGFFGYERVVGSVGGRTGSFVLQHSGLFKDGTSTGAWSVVANSGTGELRALRGEGGFVAPGGPSASYTLDYDVG